MFRGAPLNFRDIESDAVAGIWAGFNPPQGLHPINHGRLMMHFHKVVPHHNADAGTAQHTCMHAYSILNYLPSIHSSRVGS